MKNFWGFPLLLAELLSGCGEALHKEPLAQITPVSAPEAPVSYFFRGLAPGIGRGRERSRRCNGRSS